MPEELDPCMHPILLRGSRGYYCDSCKQGFEVARADFAAVEWTIYGRPGDDGGGPGGAPGGRVTVNRSHLGGLPDDHKSEGPRVVPRMEPEKPTAEWKIVPKESLDEVRERINSMEERLGAQTEAIRLLDKAGSDLDRSVVGAMKSQQYLMERIKQIDKTVSDLDTFTAERFKNISAWLTERVEALENKTPPKLMFEFPPAAELMVKDLSKRLTAIEETIGCLRAAFDPKSAV